MNLHAWMYKPSHLLGISILMYSFIISCLPWLPPCSTTSDDREYSMQAPADSPERLRLVEVAYCQCIKKPMALKGAGCSWSWNWIKDLVTTWTEKYEKLLCWPNISIYFKCLDLRCHLCGSISLWLKNTLDSTFQHMVCFLALINNYSNHLQLRWGQWGIESGSHQDT